jgi:N-methylhydantoinase A
MNYRVGIDIGGTFTDLIMYDGDTPIIEKVLSTPEDNSKAVITGLNRLAERLGLSLEQLLKRTAAIVHGTTVADNALIEGKGAVVGLLTTEGFRDEIELRRGYKEDIWDVRLEPPRAIVPRRRRLTVRERIAADGTIVTPLDEAHARQAINRLARQGVDSVAIVTLFSFVNPVHEKRLAELVVELIPGAAISVSHLILPKAPEFERMSTTVVNSFVAPRVTAYLDNLVGKLRASGYERDLLVMQSSGGVMSRNYIRFRPIAVLASGPAGGVTCGANMAASTGLGDLLCVDMGGTSFDVSVIRNGVAPAEASWNWHHRWLVALPMVSVETLGAGGGSIAQVRSGMLQAGPESAAASPGPVCYGLGGDRPTVTDANLLMGFLSAEGSLAGGRLKLSINGVREAMRKHVAEPMGYSVEEAASDVWRLVNANMTQAIRRLTAEKGTDPTKLAMLAYGGNGPVHAAFLAQSLGIRKIVVPRASSAFSALGVLSAAPLIDEERSYISLAREASVQQLDAMWRGLTSASRRYFAEAGFDPGALTFHYQLNMRYAGQNWSLPVSVKRSDPAAPLQQSDIEAVIEQFHARHEREYSYARRGEDPEITGVRVTTTSSQDKPKLGSGVAKEERRAVAQGMRRANFGGGSLEASVYCGPELAYGEFVEGPAIIDETFTTIVVPPQWMAALDEARNYILRPTK